MKQQYFYIAAALLALVGLLDSLYLSYAHYTLNPLTCNLLDGCNIVAQSAYSKLFGIPLAYLGVGFYLLLLKALSWLLFPDLVEAFGFAPAFFVRWGQRIFVFASIAGALASAVFVYIQVVYIQALCVYCLVSATVAVLLAIIAIALVIQKKRPSVASYSEDTHA